MSRKAELKGRKKTVLQSRRSAYGRPYLVAGVWSLAASVALYVLWLYGFIPWVAEVPFLATISIGVGVGIGVLIVSRLYPGESV